ncbi:serine hydrolase [bacterium]|nr:serine hydrolase [bacterium]MCI0606398.1 serine hydrolase [bacterium]
MKIMTILILFTAIAFADPVDDFVKKQMEERKIPGLSIAVIKNGEIVKTQGYGFSNLEHQVPAKPETVYQSGSVGKQFTATGVMMLVEEGKVNLDDPITKYFTEGPESWKKVKVRHLLSHTGGISNKLYDQINMREDHTEEQILKKIAALPLDFEPGTKWNYSNPGYVLLGILIHKVSGAFYGDFLQERIFKPLGMSTTRIINESDIIPNRAAGYVMEKEQIKNQSWVAPMINTTADGSLYFTVLDLAKWDGALYTETLLKKSSFDQMWTPTKLNNGKSERYGFGWGFDEIRGHKIIAHGGSWQGFTTYIARYVNDKLTVVVLTNFAGANPGSIAKGVAGIYNTDLKPIEPVEVKIDPKILDAYVGDYQLEETYVIKITKENDHLMGLAPEQPKFQLFPESETKFFLKVDEGNITFVKDKSGKVTHILLEPSGRTAKRIK